MPASAAPRDAIVEGRRGIGDDGGGHRCEFLVQEIIANSDEG
jgi:hypothetical protein